MTDADVGYYDLYQLTSSRGGKYFKAHDGVFPWSEKTIERMVKRGDFPPPLKGLGQKNVWRKRDVHEWMSRREAELEEEEQKCC